MRRAIILSFIRLTEARREYICRIKGKDIIVTPYLGYSTDLFGLHRIGFKYSEFLADSLVVKPNDRVLEIGTGCGLIALWAADVAAWVVATDVNPCAVECARRNVLGNGAFNVDVRLGDLFAPVDGQLFDLIIWHIPYYLESAPADATSSEHFYLGGRELITRFIHQCPDHLKEGGRVQFALGTIEDTSFVWDECAKAGLSLRRVAEWSGFTFIEGEVVYEGERAQSPARRIEAVVD